MATTADRVVLAVWCSVVAAKLVAAGIACLSNPCLHGICIDDIDREHLDVSTYACYCVDGYTGVQCQTNWDECWSDPCLNGGTCIDGIASYNCSCPDGFIGESCETNYNECESNPCTNNGTCIDMTNGYMCSCVPGFSGTHCELDVAVCNATEEVRCHNGGQCIEGPGFRFYCKCMPGWAGKHCEDQIDECESNPCRNGGICIDVYADYMCACTMGYTGKSCEVAIEFCSQGSCSEHALCVVEGGQRVCYCVPDYHGERCELQYDECALGPRCLNGGSCIDGVDNFTCSCPPMLTGPLCDCLILDDGTYECGYISPTTWPISTESVLTTRTSEETNIFTETTTSLTAYNDTVPRVPTTDLEAWTTTTGEIITTAITGEIATTTAITDIATTTDSTTSDMVTTTEISTTTELIETTTELIVATTTSESAISITPEPFTTVTIDSGASHQETTTECTESCEKETDSTAQIPSVTTSSTIVTESTELTTTAASMDIPTSTSIVTTTPQDAIDVVTTPKVDATTEKMFTDTPTEHTMTDVPTPQTHTTTTDVLDISTPFDNSTYVYTTVQSECTDVICNNHGTCVNSPNGARCHCVFNYAGRYCEDKIVILSAAFGGNSYVAHKVRNATSIDIGFNAKTLITDGQIMQVDIAKGVYMQLYMSAGLLKFKFSCGYQTMLLSELKTFVNKGYLMKIETRLDLYLDDQHCNATLRLNDTVAMSGGQVANISSLDHNTTIYFGNSPFVKDSDSKPFIGCLKDLVINGEPREVFGDAVSGGEVSECSSLSCLSAPCHNGGSCSDHGQGYTCSCTNGWMGPHCNESVCAHNPCQSGGGCARHPGSGFLCLCPYGKHGIFCEYNVEITRPSLSPIAPGISSYLQYPLSASAMNSERFELRLRFQATDMDQIALLAFVGQMGRHDSRSPHLALTFVKGYVMLTWNLGNGPRRIFTSRPVSARRGGHLVRLWRRGRAAGLSVDGRLNATGNAPGSVGRMPLLPYLYVGGHSSEYFRDLPHDLPLHAGWRGCVWEVSGAGLGRGAAGRGVGQCGVAQCTAKSCNAPNGVCIQSPATYGCICNEGWFGPTCSFASNPCEGSRCRGRCVLTATAAHCDCPYEKTGPDCDRELIPTDVLFTGVRSYLRLKPRRVASVGLALAAEIKPSSERGLIILLETPHFYTTLSMQGGVLEYRWIDRVSGLSSVVRSGAVVPLDAWLPVKAGRYGSRLYVWADGALATAALLAHAYPHTAANATITVGGAPDLSQLPSEAMSGAAEPFAGCVRALHVDNVLVTLEPHNVLEGQNLADCDGTVCGSELCGGGACTVEGGRARCACSGAPGTIGGSSIGAGGRCRRHAGCRAASCRAPAGVCRGDACVCAAGYTGADCEQRINITIPQFGGDSLLRVGPTPAGRGGTRAGQQRAGPFPARPARLALNFTTAHRDGLLAWTAMDMDYLGFGLENGYLKLVWSFHLDNSTVEVFEPKGWGDPGSSKVNARLVPHAGFLADAEWHTVVLTLETKNVTVTVDGTLAYAEEPGLWMNPDYEDVDFFIGGVTESQSQLAKKIFPHNFKGCIDHISTEKDSYITDFTELYSENINSCQLFP